MHANAPAPRTGDTFRLSLDMDRGELSVFKQGHAPPARGGLAGRGRDPAPAAEAEEAADDDWERSGWRAWLLGDGTGKDAAAGERRGETGGGREGGPAVDEGGVGEGEVRPLGVAVRARACVCVCDSVCVCVCVCVCARSHWRAASAGASKIARRGRGRARARLRQGGRL